MKDPEQSSIEQLMFSLIHFNEFDQERVKDILPHVLTEYFKNENRSNPYPDHEVVRAVTDVMSLLSSIDKHIEVAYHFHELNRVNHISPEVLTTVTP